ncbi:DUF938 domain-containing protein [Aestuariibacter sp. GS-14]|uniref:DUF938 domain-containing protein n=1 Tax=Aestuariibacter sp. GS-14 TaxID=2590670 RepID=UPI00112C90BF|nr:DUF938 domain-containing protein [Aestuariibacter sp. GS-14]TPV61897.1 DUF938 domain-containing protein [Aestuariibacter sp. GS-14]
MTKPFSQACENNKQPILTELSRAFSNSATVLEIGSGTGQHAVHFARYLPHLHWHTSDVIHNHVGINAWLDDADLTNLHRPIELMIGKHDLPALPFDAVYTANTGHIMFADEVALMMKSVAQRLPKQGVFCQYGPFTLNGEFSSQSNQLFHLDLLSRGLGGYKDINQLITWAGEDLILKHTVHMPANNLLLIWVKE